MKVAVGICLATAFFMASSARCAAPLFAKDGREAFRLTDQNGKPVQFRLLEGSARKRALAFAINAALGDRAGGRGGGGKVEARVERLDLRVDPKNAKILRMRLMINGELVDLPSTIDRDAFESGRKIGVRIPPQVDEAPPASVESSGHVTLRWQAEENAIEISRADANFTISAPLSEDVVENVEFHGKGLRL